MTSKPSTTDLIAVRVLREQQWAYERRLEHLSYREIRTRANWAPSEGGLGYDLSEQALKGLVAGYLERMRDTLRDEPEERLAVELADLDAQYRALADLANPVDWATTRLVATALGMTVEQLVEHAPSGVIRRDDKTRIAAIAQMRAVGESRRKLLGTDAPTMAKLDVTVHDAVAVELNEMLARAGRPPIEVPHG